jgi:limonene-1,2-epoxide hydrolase
MFCCDEVAGGRLADRANLYATDANREDFLMGAQSDATSVVRSWHTSYAAGDRLAALDHYADDAIWYLNWWREPHVGRDAIRAELDRQHDGFANYRSEIVNLFSNDGVVFIEGIDTFTMGGKDATMHWSTVLEINSEGKIARQRDYWDTKELQVQLT